MGRPDPLRRRRTHRNRLQCRRAFNPPHRAESKNALFAGSDGGGEHWAIIASLVETCKLSGVDPQAYLEDTLTKIVNGHLNTEIDELLPWSYAAPAALKDVA